MATSYSPKIITDGLVFMYDTDDGKSYKGEPTTNLITSNGIDFSQMSTYGTLIRSRVSDSNSPSGYACEMEYPNSSLNSASRIRFGDSTNIPTSGNAFVSIMAKFEGGPSSNIYPRIYSGSSWQTLAPLDGGLTYLTSEYRRFGVNAYLGTGSGGPLPAFSMTQSNSNNQAGQKTRWHSPQVELKSHATPYVDGTRSATQGLLDRTSTSTINISNASFDSNAQMTFDGTDDYLAVPHDSSQSFTGDFSIEAVIKGESNTANCIIQKGSGNDYYQEYWLLQDMRSSQGRFTLVMGKSGNSSANYLNTSNVLSQNLYYHVVATVSGSTSKIFINGVEAESGSISNRIQSTSDLRIGWRVDGFAATNGGIPIVKLYNKALTAAEVFQNYNATKGRFGL
jgi:hypothetical protein